jgi:hypothetical protein
MRKSNVKSKVAESLRRNRWKEFNAKKLERIRKRKLWEVLTAEDYIPEHKRHWSDK